MSAATVITDVAGKATAVGVLFGAAQLLLGRSQARTTFEDAVSVQYRQMIKPRLSDALLADLTPSEHELVDPYYEYLDLCNEQVFLRMQGRVRRRTWREWRQGIEANLDRGSIKDAWLAVCEKLDDFDELRLLHGSRYERDPRTWNPLWRRALHRELSASEAAIQHRALATGRRSRIGSSSDFASRN